MPKTEEEKKTLRNFRQEYGDRGEEVYFALRNKNKKFDRSQGGGFSSGKKKAAWWAMRLSKKLPDGRKSNLLGALKAKKSIAWWIDRLHLFQAHCGHFQDE